MEILSIGEKIKRARIYQGFTLKDICDDKVSVSKMSCIENGKIKPEEWIIEFVARKLDTDVEYLKQDVKEQLIKNIKLLEESKKTEDYESSLQYNLGFAESYKYNDLAFKLMHLMFSYYLDLSKLEKLQIATSKYYDICQKSGIEENLGTYYMDMARYFYITKEYAEAAGYYNNVRKSARSAGDNMLLARCTYNEAACYVMLENYERAYEIGVRLTDLIEYFDTEIRKADAYQLLGMLSIRRDQNKFNEYEKMSYELYKDSYFEKALAIYNYAVVMFDVGIKERAVEYIERSLECYPKINKPRLVDFMITVIDELLENGEVETAKSICDEALDYSIDLDNISFIEKAYYYKACILEKSGNISSAEMYMNLSLDALMKFGTKADIYKRYLQMGNMYYLMNETSDAIKYLNLAINLEKKM
jgi:tetratricopeptide (TPR) repeat protein